MSESKFAVGQQVVCITDGLNMLTEGNLYCIIKIKGKLLYFINDQGKEDYHTNDFFIPYNPKPMFKVGDKVVCINTYNLVNSKLKNLEIYTVCKVNNTWDEICLQGIGESVSTSRFNLYEPPKPTYTGKSIEQVIQERRFGITDECVKAFEKGKARIELLDKTIVGTQKKKQSLLDGVNELESAFEQKNKPACLVAIHKIGKELKLHFNQ